MLRVIRKDLTVRLDIGCGGDGSGGRARSGVERESANTHMLRLGGHGGPVTGGETFVGECQVVSL